MVAQKQNENKETYGLYAHVNKYLLKNIYPFHMPGHKRNLDFFPKNLIEYDLTEIDGMDNLHYPNSVIRETENKIASIYASERSYILVNGSTSGITASIMAHTGEGKKLLLARNCHKSAYSGLIMSGGQPKYVLPQIMGGVSVGVEPDSVKNAMEKDSEISCVLITSPTYEGMTSDIEMIAKIVHNRKGAILIVDEAHGAHFPFHEKFPVSAVNYGADLVIHSLHKTLPVLGQCSALHVCSERVNLEMLESALRAVQTTSPSYMFMSMIDKILSELNESDMFDRYVKTLRYYRVKLAKNKFLRLQETSDISKLWFDVGSYGMTGSDAMSFFRKHGIELEMCGFHHVLAMTSVADKPHGFEKLLSSARLLDEEIAKLSLEQNLEAVFSANGSTEGDYTISSDFGYVFSPREVFYMKKKEVKIDNSLGHVAAQFITPYPPGIPLIVPGELITGEHLNFIFKHACKGASGITIEGLSSKILVVDYENKHSKL